MIATIIILTLIVAVMLIRSPAKRASIKDVNERLNRELPDDELHGNPLWPAKIGGDE